MRSGKIISLVVSLIIFIGALTLFTSSMYETTDINYKESVSFNESFIIPKGKAVTVDDELKVKLLSTGDSRCPENTQCIWQGELTYKIEINNPDGSEEIELGTVKTPEGVFKNYKITLDSNDSVEYVRLTITKN